MAYILAADIGGTKLANALFTTEGTLVVADEIRSEKEDSEKLFASLVDSFRALCVKADVEIGAVTRVSIGLPGILDVERGLC